MMTQEQILKSPTLAARVAQRLRSEPREENLNLEKFLLKQEFEIIRIQASQLFQISSLAPDPKFAAKTVNLFVEEYVKQHYESRQAIREKARQGLEKELASLEKRVQFSETELVRYARDNNILNLDPNQGELVQKKLSILDEQVANLEAELANAKSRLESVQSATAKEFPEKFMTPVIQDLNSRLLQLEHQLTALRTSYGENWPAVVQKRDEIKLVRAQFENEKSVVLAQAREQAQLDLRAVETRKRLISTSLGEQKDLVNRFHSASIQYNILRREVETNQKLYEGLLERLKQTGVMAGLEFGNIQVIEPGRPNPTVDTPKLLWNLGLAAFLGLALGICMAFLLDFWDTSISTLEEVEQVAAVPCLGSVPLIKPSKLDLYLPVVHEKQLSGSLDEVKPVDPPLFGSPCGINSSPEVAEAMRTICASILLSRSEQIPRVIMFTSATPSEGKTTLVSHLGRAFADNGSKTLLVEADLRKPELSKRFRAGSENGLSLFLAGLQTALPKIHATDHPNLSLVTSGPKAPNPVALFNSEKMDYFLDKMSLSYQFVLIDAPPVLAVADARVLGSKADGVVLVVRAGRTSKNLVLRAKTLIEHSGATVLGMVLNGAKSEGYYGSYYSYNKYYQEPEVTS
jgi:capsular exopolysaccharide synthesis family protein